VSAWTCPACNRQFGRRNQSHVCAPAAPLEDYLDILDEPRRRACEAVLECLGQVGEVVVDAVNVGILVKRQRTFVELRPAKGRMVLSFILSRDLRHPRVARSIALSGRRRAHSVDLRGPEDVDTDVRAWLSEAYADSPID
jgi:hypothetical protein